MKQLVVLSGKGGSGKTTVCASLAHLASQNHPVALVDADVDAANLALLLSVSGQQKKPYFGGSLAQIIQERCTDCGICMQVCRFSAVKNQDNRMYSIDPINCEGCAACFYQCPSHAIEMVEQQSGTWHRAETQFGVFFDAHLYPGQENSGRLVTHIVQQARDEANMQELPLVFVDGPPGIGCPVIAACTNANIALLVAEPTITGLHDLKRIYATVKHFGITAFAIINKADINSDFVQRIKSFCVNNNIELLAELPFDEIVVKAMLAGKTLIDFTPRSLISQQLRFAWDKLQGFLLT